jgi:hypothetical protein
VQAIHDRWERILAVLLAEDPDFSPIALETIRATYFAGAYAVFDAINHKDLAALERMYDEVRDFGEERRAKVLLRLAEISIQ